MPKCVAYKNSEHGKDMERNLASRTFLLLDI